jgi:hypothetical protein
MTPGLFPFLLGFIVGAMAACAACAWWAFSAMGDE